MRRNFLLLLGIVLFAAACASNPMLLTPPLGAAVADCPTLVVGSKFVFQQTGLRSNEVSATITKTVEKRERYKDKPAYWIQTIHKAVKPASEGSAEIPPSYDIIDLELNKMAVLVNKGELISFQPYLQEFSWPLFVGKEWVARYGFWSVFPGVWQASQERVRVENHAKVKVPAGEFEVFKVKRVNEAPIEVYYYAPAIGMVVKREITRNITIGYPPGSGSVLWELVSYNFPQH